MEEMQYLVYRRFSEIEAADVEWLWFPYLPRGKIVLLSAPPGIGKTFFSLYLCSVLSFGRRFFGESEEISRQPEVVVYQTAEDGVADTLKKRLEKISPLTLFENIFNVDETEYRLSLAEPEAIEEILRATHPALMIFDPLQAYLGTDIDMHRANQVRPVLAKIGDLAEKYNCTMLFIMHNSKMQQSNAIYSVLGSVDIPAVSRSMLALFRHPENEEQLILTHVKSSLTEYGQSIVFHLDNGQLVFDEYSDLTAEELYQTPRRKRLSARFNEAVQVLQDELVKNGGYLNQHALDACMKAHHISRSTFYRAKKDLALHSFSVGFQNRQTYWLMPDTDEAAVRKRIAEATSQASVSN